MQADSPDKAEVHRLRCGAFYSFNSIALPLGMTLAFLAAPAVFFVYPHPQRVGLACVSVAVGTLMWLLWRKVLPEVRTPQALDTMVAVYFSAAFLAQAVTGVWLQQEQTLPHACLLLGGALAFCSTLVYCLTMAVGIALSVGWHSLAGIEFPNGSLFYLFFIAPCVGTMLRFALVQSLRELEHTRAASEKSLGQLSASQERLRTAEAERGQDIRGYHSQKMQSLGLLARGIAHDFNNYLLAIVAVSESIQSESSNDQVKEYAKQIESAALNAADVCKEMLTFTGKSQLRKEYIEPNGLLKELKPLLKAAMPKNVQLTFRAADDSLTVLVDPSQLKQAILNLVTNAVEATQPKGGQVTVSCTPFTADREDSRTDEFVVGARLGPGEYIAFSVSDNGRGMDADTLAQVFDPYFTTKKDGHGFGLSVTSGIVKGHGGAIRCSSVVGAGTTITVVLPRVRRVAHEEQPATLNTISALGSILVVDDEPIVLDSVSRMLSAVGWSVSKAENGEAALKLLCQHSTDFIAVVLDYSMPGMNGLEVVKAMREENLTTPVVLCSGFMEPTGGETNGVTADAFIKKPYRMETLQSAIATALIGQDSPAFSSREAFSEEL